ncbi:MAG: hypothetical protein ABIN83_06400 [Sphingomicrobium sp.]
MRNSLMAALLAGSMAVSACSTVDNARMSDVGTGAGVGALAGAGVGAVVGGISPIQGAVAGAAIGGLAGAVWSDSNNDGYADGYSQNGQYYQGQPSGWDSTLGRVGTGVAGGAVLGAAAGALIPGVSLLEGAIAGAVVGGLAGAIWADQDRDGRVDGYMYNGQYYQGAPNGSAPMPMSQPTSRTGERG